MTLQDDLIRDEDLRPKPYQDSVGKLTIGVGRNLEDNGITRAEAIYLLNNDIAEVEIDLDRNVPWWRELPEPVQNGLANMCFNLGWPRLSRFKKMFAALEAHDYQTAANEALYSKWATQVGERAQRIAAAIRKQDDE